MFSYFTKSKLNEELLATIEDTLILADIGVSYTATIIEKLRSQRFNKDITIEELKSFIANNLVKTLSKYEKNIQINAKPFVILVFGTNGSGKTTTIGKLGNRFKQLNYKVLFAAGDTFRAGATEQLQTLGQNLDIPVFVKNAHLSEPSALIYQAYNKAKEENYDILIADTSGRFSNNVNLIGELKKVDNTLKKISSSLPHESILVLDSTIGQASLGIAKGFLEAININSLIFTKLDGNNKGGCVIPITTSLQLPISFLGTGEKNNDLLPFDPKIYVQQLLET